LTQLAILSLVAFIGKLLESEKVVINQDLLYFPASITFHHWEDLADAEKKLRSFPRWEGVKISTQDPDLNWNSNGTFSCSHHLIGLKKSVPWIVKSGIISQY